jgi:hypothetical protein
MGLSKRVILAANAALAIVLLYLFLSSLDLESAFSLLSAVKLEWVALALAFFYALQLTTALRLQKLSNALTRKRVGLERVLWAHLAARLASDYTPGRAGYALFALKARGWGLKARQGMRAFGVSLASDFFTRGVFAALSVYLLFESVESLAFASIFLLAGSIFVLWALLARRAVAHRLLSLVPSFGGKLSAFYDGVFSKSIPTGLVYYNVGVSFLGAALRGLEWMCLAAALGHSFAFGDLLVFTAFNAVLTGLSFVPLSVAGLGLQEGAGALFFSTALGMDFAFAAALMLLIRIVEAAGNLAGLKGLF